VGFGVRARGPDQCRTDTLVAARGPGDRQPPTRPPAEVRPALDRAEPYAADHQAGPVPGDQGDGPRVVVLFVQVVAGEQALFVDEHLPAQPPVGGQRGRAPGWFDVEGGLAVQGAAVTE
jgi:hypothetical protein